MRHLPLLVLTCAALFLAACGDSDSDSRRQDPPRPRRPAQDLGEIKTYLLDHTKRLQADVVKLRENAEAYHKLAESADFDNKKLLAEHRDEVATLMKDAKATFVDGQPRLRGDGGRRRRRARARRLRRDHRRRRRRLGSRDRRAVLDQDRGRAHVQAARQPLLPGRELALRHRAQVLRQGRPRRRRQGRVRRVAPRRALLPRRGQGVRRARRTSSTPPRRSGRRTSRTR